MGRFNGLQATSVGLNLLAKLAATSRPLVYTKVRVGDGSLGATPIATLTALISPRLTLDIAMTPQRAQAGRWDVSAVLRNTGLSTGFYFREWGIFARDPDSAAEVLICYGNSGSLADYIPAEGGPDIIEKMITAACVVGSVTEVTAEVVADQLFVTQQEFGVAVDEINDELLLKVPITLTINGKMLSADIMLNAADVGAVPTGRTVNGKALSSNISLTAADVVALAIAGGTLTGAAIAGGSQAVGTAQMRNIRASTTDLTAGSSALPTGQVYLVYE